MVDAHFVHVASSPPSKLGQLLPIAGCEIRLQLRRGGPWIAPLVIQLTVLAFVLYLSWSNVNPNRQYLLGAEDISSYVSKSLIDLLPMAILLYSSILPITLADTIPAERRSNTLESLHAVVLSPGVYLAGKVLGAVGVQATMLLLATILQVLLAIIFVGGVSTVFFVETISFVWFPLLAYATSMSVLLTSTISSRRWAWAVAVVFALVTCVSAFSTIPRSPSANVLILDWLFPARSPAFRFLQTCSFTALKQQSCVIPLPIALSGFAAVSIHVLVIWASARHMLFRERWGK